MKPTVWFLFLLITAVWMLEAAFASYASTPIQAPIGATPTERGTSAAVALPPGRLPWCAQTMLDAANPPNCLQASSVPISGTLLVNGPDFNVGPSGDVGIRTANPAHALDVNGDIRGSARIAAGNDGEIGLGSGTHDKVFDLSHTIRDFSSSPNWHPFRSTIRCDSPTDLTGSNATYIYGHNLETQTPFGNTANYEYLQGPNLRVLHLGTGQVGILGGTLISAYTHDGFVSEQIGASCNSTVGNAGSVDQNVVVDVRGGHRGSAGSIDSNTMVRIRSPYADQKLRSHYGLYIENQDYGMHDSYSIYSEGGANYLADHLGLGEPNPGNILTVAQGSATDPIADAWLTYSSSRWKEKVEPLKDALSKVQELQGVRFEWKGTERRDLGLIAEDVAKVVPEIVGFDSNGELAQGVDYARLTAVLVEAIKEQQAEIVAMQTQMDELRTLVEEFEHMKR